MISKIASLGIAVALLSLSACAPVGAPAADNQPLPEGTVARGSLTNQKLKQDATMGAFMKLVSKGYDMVGNHNIRPYVVSKPKGAPGSRHWTEKWFIEVKGQHEPVPVTIDFKESGSGAADWKIR
jgi:hypothetical protein